LPRVRGCFGASRLSGKPVPAMFRRQGSDAPAEPGRPLRCSRPATGYVLVSSREHRPPERHAPEDRGPPDRGLPQDVGLPKARVRRRAHAGRARARPARRPSSPSERGRSRAGPSGGVALDRAGADGPRLRLGRPQSRVLMLPAPILVVVKLASVLDALKIRYLVGGVRSPAPSTASPAPRRMSTSSPT